MADLQTPDGIILPVDPVSLAAGVHSGEYKLGEIVRCVSFYEIRSVIQLFLNLLSLVNVHRN